MVGPLKMLAQSPIQEFWALNQNLLILDQAKPISNPSFAYSLRKLKRSYLGYALRVRRNSDNAQVDVSFDSKNVVSTNSSVRVSSVGSGSLTVGSTINFSTFKGAARLFVSIWYDQGQNAYHAVQTTNSIQPELIMNSAGTSSTLPSLYFDGSYYVTINQPIQNLVASGIRGSLMFALKTTSNSNHFAFGYRNSSTDWRWASHINWSDGNCYFDAGEVCCATFRSFVNSPNVNIWKQYSFIRGSSYKTVRVSKAATALNSSSAASTSQTGGGFNIGSTFSLSSVGFLGNISEAILFPVDIANATIAPLETNQINYWGL